MKVIFKKAISGLVPTDEPSREALKKIKLGSEVLIELKQSRSVGHHRKFFALLQIVKDNMDTDYSVETILQVIKIRAGYVDVVKTRKGIVEIPRSISFSSMDQPSFEAFWDDAIRIICSDIIPGLNRRDLETEILEMIGDKTASQCAGTDRGIA